MYRHGSSCRGGMPSPRQRARWRKAALLSTRRNDTEAPPALDDPPIRVDLVQRVRQAIRDGVYETSEKWQGALERLMERET
jgi:hypothetical protein